MKRFFSVRAVIPLLLFLSSVVFAAAPYEFNVDFRANLKYHDIKRRGQFKGPLPKGLIANSVNWNTSRTVTSETNDGLEHFLRFHVTRSEQGAVFVHPLIPMDKTKTFKITFQYRAFFEGEDARANFTIRKRNYPYRSWAVFSLPPTKTWKRVDKVFRLNQHPDKPEDLGFVININAPGKLDLVTIRLEECDPELFGKNSDVIRPAKNARNYFRTSRFPLGIQSGWHFGRYDNEIVSISKENGPSGVPYFSFCKGALTSEPFQVPDEKKEYTCSFFYKGGARISIGGKSQMLPYTKTWKRTSIDFKGEQGAKGYCIHFLNYGGRMFSLDGLRCGAKGEKAYAAPGLSEVALGLPKSDVSSGRVQFTDEKPLVNYYLCGERKGVKLRFTVTDLYGESRKFTVSPKKVSGTVSYDLFKDKLGQFRIEVFAEKNGKAISPVNELVVTRLQRPLYWGKFHDATKFYAFLSPCERSIRTIKATGLNGIDVQDAATRLTGWAYLEPEKGKWVFPDKEVALYRNNHMNIIGRLQTAPFWATEMSRLPKKAFKASNTYHYRYCLPDNIKDWENYVRTIATRYKGVINRWIIWDEPWGGFIFKGIDKKTGKRIPYESRAEKAGPYFRLYKPACIILKEVDPNNKIMGFGNTGGAPGDEWNRLLTAMGAHKYNDFVGGGAYTSCRTGFPGDIPESAMKSTQESIARHCKRQYPICPGVNGVAVTAGGDSVCDFIGMYKHSVPWKNREDYHKWAHNQVCQTISFLGNGAALVKIYSIHCYSGILNRPGTLGLVQTDGYPHPQIPAYSAMTRLAEDRNFAMMTEPAPKVYAWIFEGKKSSVAFIIPKYDAKKTMVVSKGKSIMRDLYGNALDFRTAKGKMMSKYLYTIEMPGNAKKLAANLKTFK